MVPLFIYSNLFAKSHNKLTMKSKTQQTSLVWRLVLTLLSWYGLQRLQTLPLWALACSLSPCPDGEIYAPTEPDDTNLMLLFPKNTTCSVLQLPLACSGCASCDSQYIYEWGDKTSGFTVDDFTCATAMNPDNGISCADLVFGNISFDDNDNLSTNFAGHCGWDDNSGRDICPWADSSLSGGIQVCLANETNVQETAPIIIRDIVLRYVGFACVSNGTMEETKPPKASPANGTTAMPTTNGTISPTPSPTMSPTTTMPTTAFPTTLPTTEVDSNSLRSVATNTPSAAVAARRLVIHPTWGAISTGTVLSAVMAGFVGLLW